MSSLWLSGGMRDIVEISNRLVERGHHITFIIPGDTYDQDMAKEIDPQIKIVESPYKRSRKMNPFKLIRLTLSMALQVPLSDVIISTHTPTTLVSWIAKFIFHKGDLVWFYQDYIEMFIGNPAVSWLTRNALRWHKGAFVLSESSRQELQGFVKGKNIIVSGEGLSHPDLFKPLPDYEISRPSSERRIILFLGDMRPRKGLYDFLYAAEIVYEQNKDIFLQIVSKEDCQIQSKIPFEYIFRPTRERLANLYATCDIFVSASWWESFGFPPLEAMACGAPVVMTDSRGGREYAEPGENCLMVKPRDPNALAQAIIQVLSKPEVAKRLRQNGPKTAALFSWDKATDKFESGLQQFLK